MALHTVTRGLLVTVRGLLVALAAVAIPALASAQPSAEHPTDPPPLVIDSDTTEAPVIPHVQLYEDASRSQSLQQVRAERPGWKATTDLALGFSHSVWWARVTLVNPGAVPRSLVLDLQQPLQDHVEWFVTADDGRVLSHDVSGDRLPFSQRPMNYRGLALPLTLPAAARREIYIRLDTYDGLFDALYPVLHDAETFRTETLNKTLLNGLYFGGLLALTLYNLLVWLLTRGRGFGLYVVYAASFFVWGFTYRGFGFEWLWPNSPNFNNQVLAVTAAMSFIGCGAFTLRYLRLAERAPPSHARLIRILLALNAVPIALAVAAQYAWAFAACIPTGLASMLAVIAIGLDQTRRGSREARVFVAAFLPLAATATLTLLVVSGAIAPLPWLDAGWQISSSLEMLLLAIGLADSMNRLRAQKLAAEREARALSAKLAAGLEQEVHKRTLELESANRLLSDLSITDALTGAFNRRHFETRCRELLLAQRRTPAPLAMCMFDLDHFKAYNDRYGHQAGDHVLSSVAGAVRARLRRDGDQLFRLGGEEFCVMFASTTAAGAAAFADELRCAVRDLAIPHEPSAAGIVTASFGLAYWAPQELVTLTPELLYAEVDRLLYQAKAAGRDRVACSPTLDTASSSDTAAPSFKTSRNARLAG